MNRGAAQSRHIRRNPEGRYAPHNLVIGQLRCPHLAEALFIGTPHEERKDRRAALRSAPEEHPASLS
jgi:hypothetical protein